MENLGIQIQRNIKGIINNNSYVIFNKIINNKSENISYDTSTGIIKILQSGNYLFQWWISINENTSGTNFVITSLKGDNIRYDLIDIMGSIEGDTIITISQETEIVIQNQSGFDVIYNESNVKVNLTIIELNPNKGEKGEKGIKGDKGIKGNQGAKGDTGKKGNKGEVSKIDEVPIIKLGIAPYSGNLDVSYDYQNIILNSDYTVIPLNKCFYNNIIEVKKSENAKHSAVLKNIQSIDYRIDYNVRLRIESSDEMYMLFGIGFDLGYIMMHEYFHVYREYTEISGSVLFSGDYISENMVFCITKYDLSNPTQIYIDYAEFIISA